MKKLKVDFVFTPITKDIYSIKLREKITLAKSQMILCAKYRKGHFEGVLEIMERFIKLIKPKYIFMGNKDYQQLYLVNNHIKHKYKSKIYPCKTVRNKNKLALSSRNNFLSKKGFIQSFQNSTYIEKNKTYT